MYLYISYTSNGFENKKAKMALNHPPEYKVVCFVEIRSESAWALTNITSGNTCHATFHAPEVSGFEEEDFNIFSVYFYGANPGHPLRGP